MNKQEIERRIRNRKAPVKGALQEKLNLKLSISNSRD